MTIRSRNRLTRRGFLKAGASLAAVTALPGVARPYLSRAADRPAITHGLQSGDVSIDAGMIWSRSDRPPHAGRGRDHRQLQDPHAAFFVDALPESDFTAKALIEDLPPGQDMFYRVRFQDHAARPSSARRRSGISAPRPPSAAPSRFCGRATRQARAGASTRRAAACAPTPPCCATRRIFSSIAATSSMPIARSRAEIRCPTAASWRNLVTEEKSAIAQTLAQFRGNYKYNLLDRHLRAFNAAGAGAGAMGRSRSDAMTGGRRGAIDERIPERARLLARARPRLPRIHADRGRRSRKRRASTARSATARCSIFS